MKRTVRQTLDVAIELFVHHGEYAKDGQLLRWWSPRWWVQLWRDARVLGA